MAPRSRSRAQQAAAGDTAALKITDLPEAVLAHTLGFLELRDRRLAALACRLFAAAANSPQLLRQLDVELHGLMKLASFLAFVTRHGRHVQQLSFAAYRYKEEDYSRAAAAIAACLAAAGAAGQLTALKVADWLPSTEWLASMPGLHSLTLELFDPTPPSLPALSMLAALQELELCGTATTVAPSVQLPTSITRLTLRETEDEAVPSQVAQLPALQRLCLESCSYLDESMAGLSALSGSLTYLRLFRTELPPSLSALTGMQHLALLDAWLAEGDAENFNGALARLQHLTCLAIETGLHALPPAVRGLGQLRLLYFVAGGDVPAQPLPSAGPWLQHLEGLAVDADILIPSSAVLAAAPRLTDVVLSTVPDSDSPSFATCFAGPAWRAFWAWAATHRPLSRLSIAIGGRNDSPVWERLFDAVVVLRGKRPTLTVDRDCWSFYHKLGE